MKNIILCENHKDLYNRLVQAQITSFLKAKGYNNLYSELVYRYATPDEIHKDLYLTNIETKFFKKKLDYSYINIPVFKNQCEASDLPDNNYRAISSILYNEHISNHFPLKGFDISPIALVLDEIIDLVKKEEGNLVIEKYFVYIYNIFEPTLEEFLSYTERESEEQVNLLIDLTNEALNRYQIIVNNVLELSTQTEGNIFIMGAAHCLDIKNEIRDTDINNNFVFILPISDASIKKLHEDFSCEELEFNLCCTLSNTSDIDACFESFKSIVDLD